MVDADGPPRGALIAAVAVVVLFAGVVFGYAFVRNQENQDQAAALAPFTPTAENQDPSTQIPGVAGRSPTRAAQHVDPASRSPTPTARRSAARTTTAGRPATASSTRGRCAARTWCTRWSTARSGSPTTPTRSPATRSTRCGSKVEGQPYTVMSPYPGLDQPISLQSWGHQLKLTDAERPADRPVHRRAAAEPVHRTPSPARAATSSARARLLPGQPAAVRRRRRRPARPARSRRPRAGAVRRARHRPVMTWRWRAPTAPPGAGAAAAPRRAEARWIRPALAVVAAVGLLLLGAAAWPAARAARLGRAGRPGRRLGGRRVRPGHDRAPPAGRADGLLGARPHHRPRAAAARLRHRDHPDRADRPHAGLAGAVGRRRAAGRGGHMAWMADAPGHDHAAGARRAASPRCPAWPAPEELAALRAATGRAAATCCSCSSCSATTRAARRCWSTPPSTRPSRRCATWPRRCSRSQTARERLPAPAARRARRAHPLPLVDPGVR